MKEIPLTQGKIALVDDKDYDWLMQRKWKWKDDKRGGGYAAAMTPKKADRKTLYMHRVITNPDIGMVVDHIDHNTLNNQRANLRVVSQSQNLQNMSKRRNASSQYKGVHQYKGKWRAGIVVNKKHVYLGLHQSEHDAAHAYDQAARTHFGQFAKTNFQEV